jgi:ElaB/YqjD/DUF883 family membrane-anchored ribosome-binding protein
MAVRHIKNIAGGFYCGAGVPTGSNHLPNQEEDMTGTRPPTSFPARSPGSSGSSPTPGTENARPDAAAAISKAKDDLAHVGEEASHIAESVKDEAVKQLDTVKHEAAKQVDKAKAGAESFAGEQKDKLADQLSGIAGALSKTASEIGGDQPAVASYARDIARSLGRVSENIKGQDVRSIVRMTEDFGRRQPAAMLGIAALAGFMSGRFLLASSRREEPASDSVSTAGTLQPRYASGGTATKTGALQARRMPDGTSVR